MSRGFSQLFRLNRIRGFTQSIWQRRCCLLTSLPVPRTSFSVFFRVLNFHSVRFFATPWTAAHQTPLSFSISQRLLKFMSMESVMPSNHLIRCHSLLLPSVFPIIRVLSDKSALHIIWPKYWSFSSSVSLSNEYSGLISFRMDWFDLRGLFTSGH